MLKSWKKIQKIVKNLVKVVKIFLKIDEKDCKSVLNVIKILQYS